jgi:IS30 family transposase
MPRRKWQHLTPQERTVIRTRVWTGDTYVQIATALGCSRKTIQRVCRSTGGMKPRPLAQSSFHLSLAEREEISRGLQVDDSCRAIARRLGRAPSTIARAIAASGGRARYRAWRATTRAAQLRQRPKSRKLVTESRLLAVVEQGLEARWSPQQIAARLPPVCGATFRMI